MKTGNVVVLSLLLAVSTVHSGCGSAASDPTLPDLRGAVRAQLGADVELALGETARWPEVDVAVSFRSLESDSRCPIDLSCIWEGDASVALDVVQGPDVYRIELHTTLHPRSLALAGATLRLVDVRPHPVAEPVEPPPPTTVVLSLSR